MLTRPASWLLVIATALLAAAVPLRQPSVAVLALTFLLIRS